MPLIVKLTITNINFQYSRITFLFVFYQHETVFNSIMYFLYIYFDTLQPNQLSHIKHTRPLQRSSSYSARPHSKSRTNYNDKGRIYTHTRVMIAAEPFATAMRRRRAPLIPSKLATNLFANGFCGLVLCNV